MGKIILITIVSLVSLISKAENQIITCYAQQHFDTEITLYVTDNNLTQMRIRSGVEFEHVLPFTKIRTVMNMTDYDVWTLGIVSIENKVLLGKGGRLIAPNDIYSCL
jgi:hypothetical protein